MTQSVQLRYGDDLIPVDFPEHTTVVSYPESYQDPAGVDDPVAATRQALANPVGSPPLSELAGPGKTVAIAFPDKVKSGFGVKAHRRIAIPMILEVLERAGVRETDITLVCAMGLHRKNTRDELVEMLGEGLVARFYPERLLMHDAEDPDGIVRLGRTVRGDVVDMNRAVYEADIPIMVGHAVANPYGGYSGGYKMCATGLSTWQSIRCHHTPSTMHRSDFIPSNHQGLMRDQFDEIG
ncbi:MAG: lactate racemase domain-containing protein [Chloroflexota bacterium]|jgi:nickel-dependent lactate racemase|nr:lactate racemase domain-containing protein [Chloroflexota bacterium]MDP6758433.1 lactate racemase domain-containing protein [Chloroflexota bacterium]